jgi:hypothetical protein
MTDMKSTVLFDSENSMKKKIKINAQQYLWKKIVHVKINALKWLTYLWTYK